MRRKQVENSTSLKSVGYSRRGQTLEVEFQSGSVYQYHEMPGAVYQELTQAESKGKYFAANICTRYTFEAIEGRLADNRNGALQNDSVCTDLSAIAEYLRAEHGGRLPSADGLLGF